MSVCIILAVGCIFAAFLFNISASSGSEEAKGIRNILAGIGGVLLLAPVVYAMAHSEGAVGGVLLISAIPLVFVGLFVALFATAGRSPSAMKGAVTLVAFALILAVIGAIVLLVTGGGAE